jgi:hypothetical protein
LGWRHKFWIFMIVGKGIFPKQDFSQKYLSLSNFSRRAVSITLRRVLCKVDCTTPTWMYWRIIHLEAKFFIWDKFWRCWTRTKP